MVAALLADDLKTAGQADDAGQMARTVSR